jgi:WD40 repeat protein
MVKVWDAASGALLATLSGHTGSVWACGFSPDGARVVTASDDTVRVWDAASGTELATLTWHIFPVACGFSPDGTRVVSSGRDWTVKVWDAASGAELATLTGHTDVVWACGFSPDGTRIVSGGGDKTVKVWDAGGGAELASLSLPGAAYVIAAHPWQPSAICGDQGGGVYVLDLVGVEYGPIVVTAAARDDGLVVRCPACWREHAVQPDQLDSVMRCPTAGCGLELRLNPFVVLQGGTGDG